MNILNKVTWQAMWKNKSRTIATIIGIILSAAMFTAVITMGVSLRSYLIDVAGYNQGGYFIRFDYGTDADIAAIYEEKSVSQVGDLQALGYTTLQSDSGSTATFVVAAVDDDFFDMNDARLEEGRLPETSSEIVITRNAYHYLQSVGRACEVGDTVTLDVVPQYVPDEKDADYISDNFPHDLPDDGTAFSKTYVIVGITELFYRLDDTDLNLDHFLTYADENVEPALWHRIFVKTSPAKAAYELHDEPYGSVVILNTAMLELYGASKYNNVNQTIYAIGAVLIVIIMIGSVSLIYNAFSISVSERTRQFGLLSSIGATKRQLRRSVYFEAMSLCAIAIPIGVALGYFGICVALHFTADLIHGLLVGSTESGLKLHGVASFPAFCGAAVIAAITILLSVLLPARRATRVEPISAIRQTQDYKIPRKGIKTGKLTAKIWGLPGMMAQKYYKVSKGKYRATVISLAISVVLFITSCGYTQTIQNTAARNANTSNFDLILYSGTQDFLSEIRNHNAVEESVLRASLQFTTVISEDMFSEDYRDACSRNLHANPLNSDPNARIVDMFYLEDTVFRAYLEEHKIDPEPYFDAQRPTALVISSEITVLDGANRMIYESDVFGESAEQIFLYDNVIPNAVHDEFRKVHAASYGIYDGSYRGYHMMTCRFQDILDEAVFDTIPYLQDDGTMHVVVIPERNEDGTYACVYYFCDPEQDVLAEEPITVVENIGYAPMVYLGETVRELPFGISDHSDASFITLVMPLSMTDTETYPPNLLLRINNYNAITGYLDVNAISYQDLMEYEMQYRNMNTMINVFSYGFIILISLICMCNIFNTISTNIALRRREFGMLRSVGLQAKELNRMMIYECLRYGNRALLMGLPLGALAVLAVQTLSGSTGNYIFSLPLIPMGISCLIVFGVVFITMLYAMSKLKKDNLIEAIRMENA